MTTRGLAINFPMRPDFLAQVIVPPNMTEAEAKRLCAMIMTLPLPKQSVDSASDCPVVMRPYPYIICNAESPEKCERISDGTCMKCSLNGGL